MCMLKNPKYGGFMVQQRWRKVSYKIKKVKQTDESEWIWGGEFEGIIDKQTYKKVQRLLQHRSSGYRYKNGVIHPFSKVLICGDCGGTMIYKANYKG